MRRLSRNAHRGSLSYPILHDCRAANFFAASGVLRGRARFKVNFRQRETLVYDPDHYLLVSLDLPLVGQLEQASPSKPFLSLSLVLNAEEIGSLAREVNLPAESQSSSRPDPMVAAMDEELMDAVLRLTCLLNKPAQIAIMAPLVRREIFYKLLLSQQSGLLRRIAAHSSKFKELLRD